MALPVRTQVQIWGGVAVAIFATLWLLGDVLLPFVLGGALAYCLDPIADWLERKGLGRVTATVVISIGFLLVFVLMTLLVVPALVRQAIDLVEVAPEMARNLREFLTGHFPDLFVPDSTLNQSLADVAQAVRDKGVAVLNGLLTSALSLVNILVLLFIVPVVTFYMLIDWDRMVASVDSLLPRDHAPTVRMLAGRMDRTLASFIRGQGTVCIIQGSFYAVALMLAGLNFGLVVGAIAGLISFIPYVGSIVGGSLAIGLAIFQFWSEPLMIALIAGIFFFGQLVEGNILTPKLVGGSVGLHPVWLLLALSVFGSIFGFVGMLVAVPVSAMIGVLVRFAVDQYMAGLLYTGLAGRKDTSPSARDAAE